jgi:hypothetical protein
MFRIARRRRRRKKPDPRTALLIALLAPLGLAYISPSFGSFESMAFGAAAVGIWLVAAQRRVRDIHRWAAISNLYTVTPEDFERHVASTFEQLGYRVSLTRRVGDQGIDVIAERGDERMGIQCKRTTETVSNGAVQEAYAGKAHYNCTSSAVVSLGGFTAPARSLASTTGVQLLDGNAYADLFHKASAAMPARSVWNVLPGYRALASSIGLAVIAILCLAIGNAHNATQ